MNIAARITVTGRLRVVQASRKCPLTIREGRGLSDTYGTTMHREILMCHLSVPRVSRRTTMHMTLKYSDLPLNTFNQQLCYMSNLDSTIKTQALKSIHKPHLTKHHFTLQLVTASEVIKAINRIKSTATGADDIPITLIKNTSAYC